MKDFKIALFLIALIFITGCINNQSNLSKNLNDFYNSYPELRDDDEYNKAISEIIEELPTDPSKIREFKNIFFPNKSFDLAAYAPIDPSLGKKLKKGKKKMDDKILKKNIKIDTTKAVFFLYEQIKNTFAETDSIKRKLGGISDIDPDSLGFYLYYGIYDSKEKEVLDSLKSMKKEKYKDRNTIIMQIGYGHKVIEDSRTFNTIWNFGQLCPDYCPNNGQMK